jgi:hypothetical protein
MKKINKQNVEEEDLEFEDEETTEEEPEETEEAQEVKPQKSKERWTVGQIAKETEDVLVDNSTGKAYNQLVAMAMIMNTLEEIKRLLK